MVDLFEEGEESRDLSKVSPSLDESEFQGGGVCPSPKEKRKRDTVDITVATTIFPSLSVNSRFTRIRSFGPIHERKRVHPRLVCRECDSIRADRSPSPSHPTPISASRCVAKDGGRGKSVGEQRVVLSIID